MWSLDVVGSQDPNQEVYRKIEELAWAVAVIYGVSGWCDGSPFRADFLLYVPRLDENYIEAAKSLSTECTS